MMLSCAQELNFQGLGSSEIKSKYKTMLITSIQGVLSLVSYFWPCFMGRLGLQSVLKMHKKSDSDLDACENSSGPRFGSISGEPPMQIGGSRLFCIWEFVICYCSRSPPQAPRHTRNTFELSSRRSVDKIAESV
jgi:hypothetical protein